MQVVKPDLVFHMFVLRFQQGIEAGMNEHQQNPGCDQKQDCCQLGAFQSMTRGPGKGEPVDHHQQNRNPACSIQDIGDPLGNKTLGAAGPEDFGSNRYDSGSIKSKSAKPDSKNCQEQNSKKQLEQV